MPINPAIEADIVQEIYWLAEFPEALFELDNVVLLPHIASATEQTRQAMSDRVFDNLQLFISEGRLLSAAPAA